MASPFRLTTKGIEIYIKITPNAASDSIAGIRRRTEIETTSSTSITTTNSASSSSSSSKKKKSNSNKQEALTVPTQSIAELEIEVRVTAPPDKGKANASLLKLLSKEWKVPSANLSVATGLTSRNKKLLLETQDPEEALGRLTNWLQSNLSLENV